MRCHRERLGGSVTEMEVKECLPLFNLSARKLIRLCRLANVPHNLLLLPARVICLFAFSWRLRLSPPLQPRVGKTGLRVLPIGILLHKD